MEDAPERGAAITVEAVEAFLHVAKKSAPIHGTSLTRIIAHAVGTCMDFVSNAPQPFRENERNPTMAASDIQSHGNFIAFLARDKEPGDKRPVFEGRLSLPNTEAELHFPLWGHEYADPKTGEMMTMFNGSTDAVSTADAPKDQVAALLKNEGALAPASISNVKLRSRQVVLSPPTASRMRRRRKSGRIIGALTIPAMANSSCASAPGCAKTVTAAPC